VITDSAYFFSSKRLTLAREPLSLEEKYRILESLYDEARELGNFGTHDILLGLEGDVHLAAALNANVSNSPR
jgi:hypothetical protein